MFTENRKQKGTFTARWIRVPNAVLEYKDGSALDGKPVGAVTAGEQYHYAEMFENAAAKRLRGFAAISKGGYSSQALKLITGKDAKDYYFSNAQAILNEREMVVYGQTVLKQISDALTEGRVVLTATRTWDKNSYPGVNLIDSHDYGVRAVRGDMIALRNPDGRHPGVNTEGLFEIHISDFLKYFKVYTISSPLAPHNQQHTGGI